MSKAKNIRQVEIRDIISTMNIASQDDLMQELMRRGLTVTQATLSRDIKEMRIAKTTDIDGSYRYIIPNNSVGQAQPRIPSIDMIHTGVISIEFSGNIAVMKTQPGYANVVASAIDNTNTRTVIGCVAGDDTIFIALRERYKQDDILNELQSVIPNLKEKLLSEN
ncbi:MAG: arginine repressor [Bacteroidales bacterium]|jgi:transcriptional regulator of arginine metabolism|nr:arginine repressor [Bacteroidales bacterium]